MLDCFFKNIPSMKSGLVLITRLPVTFVVVSLALISCTDDTPIYSSDVYDLTSPLLNYSVLSDEKSYPYKAAPRFVESDEVKKAVARFPDTKGCLIEKERQKDKVDLRLIDWPQFKSRHDVSVCLWRIFISLNDTEAVENWLEFQGFKISKFDAPLKTQSYAPDTYEVQTSVTPRHQITGSYSVNKTTPQLHPYKSPNAMLKVVHGHGIDSLWIPNTDTLLHVNFNSTTE